MDTLGIARWQFGITTVYHYLFVPITIGLALFVAIMETTWLRTKNPEHLRVTKFFSKLFLVNFAIGVVTGIVQEFQFGMNWSSYSRFVGDVFGAPLAMEALLAFFIESTFLGLWIFGWDKLPPKIHAACMWMVAFGTMASAYFILAANSFMQHPVGIELNPETGRPMLNDIGAVLFQKLQLITFSHVMTTAWMATAVLIVSVGAWFMLKKRETHMFRPIVKGGLWALLVASLLTFVTGDLQGKVMTEVQPMKMAAAEALYEDADGASFSLFSIGTLDGSEEVWAIRVPKVLSFMATGNPEGHVEGINNVQQRYEQLYGPGDYKPNIPVTYWMFRFMMGAGFALLAFSIVGLWLMRRGRTPKKKVVWHLAIIAFTAGLIGNATGWIFTEMGRQPWTVVGMFQTKDSVSPSVSPGTALISLISLTAVYAVLAVIEVGLMLKTIRKGPPDEEEVLRSLGKRNPLSGSDSDGSGDSPDDSAGGDAGSAGGDQQDKKKDEDDVLAFAY